MSRRVRTYQLQATSAPSVDGYFDKVVKYIPSDVVAGWVAVSALVRSAQDVNKHDLMWIVFGVGVVLAGAWTWKQTSVKEQPVAWKQIAISTIAFIVWAVALGPPFENFPPVVGPLLLVGYTLAVGLFDPH
jgi:hypothetical protein